MKHAKVVVFGAASAVGVAIAAQISATCPDLLSRLPEIAVAGVLAGVGYFLRSPHDEAPKA